MSGRPSAGNSTSTTVPITWTTLPLVPLGMGYLLISLGRPFNASEISLRRLAARALRRRGRINPPRWGVSGGHPHTPACGAILRAPTVVMRASRSAYRADREALQPTLRAGRLGAGLWPWPAAPTFLDSIPPGAPPRRR